MRDESFQRHDELDGFIDEALATYVEPEADNGLSQRILNRVAAEIHATPRRRWMTWAVAIPVAACLLLGLLLAHRERKPAEVMQEVTRQNTPVVQPPAVPVQTPPAHKFRRQPMPTLPQPTRVTASSAALPKLDVFPTPQPLTPQEEALVVYINGAPQSERESMLAAQQQAAADLSIAAIHIPPLAPPDQDAN